MEQRDKTLGTARLIATLIYVVTLVWAPWVGRFAAPKVAVDLKVMGVLVPVLLFVGLTDYVISLLIEARLLAQARDRGALQNIISAATVTSAFGASLAVYGFVATVLGAPALGAVFYVLCAVHGFHLMLRWPRYAETTEQIGEP